MLLFLWGCPFVSDDFLQEITDADGDGYDGLQFGGTDCDDNNKAVNPGATEICGDGIDNDCADWAAGCGIWGDLTTSDADFQLEPKSMGSYNFGTSLWGGDVNNDHWPDLVVGAPYKSAAYLYLGPLSPDSEPSILYSKLGVLSWVGEAVWGGDLNHDASNDVVVGVPGAQNGAGAVLLFNGPLGAESATEAARVVGSNQTSIGSPISAGDFDGDGQLELVVPSDADDRVFLFEGPLVGNHSVEDADVMLLGREEERVGFGLWVADIDGDGFDDALVGAPDRPTVQDNGGAVHVAHGPFPAVFDLNQDGVTLAGNSNCRLGSAIWAGDIDGDAALEVVATGSEWCKAPLVWIASVTGDESMYSIEDVAVAGVVVEYLDSWRGIAVAGGDIDGDGNTDLVVGDPSTDSYRGLVMVFLGPISGMLTADDAEALIVGDYEWGDNLGTTFWLADFNGEGSDDLVVSAPHRRSNTGAVFLFSGTAGR
ncbi:MAG: hypothetical protein HN348_10805 [Proteobacteria bacterium]|nr:hypothetical protein [Pseudomonadota bacterium]